MTSTMAVNRRGFLKAGLAGAGGLLIGFYLPERSKLAAAVTPLKLNAYIHVGTDDVVTFVIHKAEMGQGTMASLPMLLAEELTCDFSRSRKKSHAVMGVS